MCANYTFLPNEKSLENEIGSYIVDPTVSFEDVPAEIYPFRNALVFVDSGAEPMLTVKRYSLTPSWAKEERVKWSTYNARLDSEDGSKRIYQMPTWRNAFEKHHCLVPLTSFRESCYGGLGDGHIVEFSPLKFSLLFAAGIFEDWVNPSSGEVISSFAIVTTTPSKFIQSVGHDRSPVLLDIQSGTEWIKFANSSESAYKFLKESNIEPEFDFRLVRKRKV